MYKASLEVNGKFLCVFNVLMVYLVYDVSCTESLSSKFNKKHHLEILRCANFWGFFKFFIPFLSPFYIGNCFSTKIVYETFVG